MEAQLEARAQELTLTWKARGTSSGEAQPGCTEEEQAGTWSVARCGPEKRWSGQELGKGDTFQQHQPG